MTEWARYRSRPIPADTHMRWAGVQRRVNDFFYGSLSSSSTNNSILELSSNSSRANTFMQSIQTLREQLKQPPRNSELSDLLIEFEQLPRQNVHTSTVAARRNETKNRYWNVLPYDMNRVLLKRRQNSARQKTTNNNNTNNHSSDSGVSGLAGDDDYINASWVTQRIDDLDLTNIYIAAQAPKKDTVTDMWRMIWQERVPLVVMLTDCHEQGVHKCEQYWPELNDTLELDTISLLVSCNHSFTPRNKSYTMRDLFIIDTVTQEQFSVVQCQMHGWPDHGTPKHTRRLLEFWRDVRQRLPPRRLVTETQETLSAPVLVHCSAGVGRSGAYILMETLIGLMDAETPIRVVDIVHNLREQRMAMVQTDEQLLCACEAALMYFDQSVKR